MARALFFVGLWLAGCVHPQPRLNVLFIAVDDLRPQLESYGAAGMKSPSIDALARRGAVFLRAYCQQALCNPSRSSVLTGMRPDSIDVHSLTTHFRQARPEIVTLPQYFKQHGYRTQALGQVFHSGLNDRPSWTEPGSWFADRPLYGDPEIQKRYQESVDQSAVRRTESGNLEIDCTKLHLGPSWEAPDVPDDTFGDGATAAHAVQLLAAAAKDQRPFFLAVGFSRPHLPLVAPRKYYDLYPEATVPLAANPTPPRDAAVIGLTNSDELRGYSDIPKEGPIPDELARKLVRGYMASTSYVDAQIGRVLDGLAQSGLAGRTVVIVWGDHGFHLGEHGIWCKGTNFEVAARGPMILVAPRGIRPGSRVNALVEFVDIFPTVAELAGLPVPAGLEGASLAPLLADPRRPWKSAAFTQDSRGAGVGRSIRTDRWRYTEWRTPSGAIERELYDHQSDEGENQNLAARPEHQALIRELSDRLRAGWRAALPR